MVVRNCVIFIKCEIMKLIIVCKDSKEYAQSDEDNNDNNHVLKLACERCKGMDIKTTIKMIVDDYGNEIKEIIYPNCDILKKVMK